LNFAGDWILLPAVQGGSGLRPEDLDSSNVYFEVSKGSRVLTACKIGIEGLFYLNFDNIPVGLLILFADIVYYFSSMLC